MGGHGGLNILPQKRWNVYNYENREKVRQDEEAAAKEEQLKREQARKRDAEFRLQQLCAARGLSPLKRVEEAAGEAAAEHVKSEPKSNHINLFEGIKIFDPIKGLEKGGGEEKDGFKRKKMRKEEEASKKVVTLDDEKYRLGYWVAGKRVKLPWYLERRSNGDVDAENCMDDGLVRVQKEEQKKGGKKTLQELREERLKREKKEKETERALFMEKSHRERTFSRDRGFYRR
ncbi:leukocyte receptor cluster member 1-like [Pistacia vera]|uniref:leukocyte receptor cluster member 1-like n=1 Tax=Pistacia vera TaxID=55513 RepID=UPI0012635ACF|nr:leukocyte receptor cluster member 1-like [Pistacia vera]